MKAIHATIPHARHGFTLLELSIVLVIIGLIVGGVMAGQSMIRNAELNSIISDTDKFRTAINSFKYKYGQIPGDFTRSSAYWPDDCGATPTYCDGDGDGIIDNDSENMRFWSHLSSAELIEGHYTYLMVVDFAPDLLIPPDQQHRPVTKIKGGAYWPYSEALNGVDRNMMGIGGTVQLSHNIDPFLTGADVYALDTKIDDGDLSTGNLRSIEPGLYVGSMEPSGSCALDSEDTGCAMFFLDFM